MFRRKNSQRGVISIEYALIFPTIIFVLLSLLQLTLWLFADRTAQAAAEHGAESAAASGGSEEFGDEAATQAFRQLPGLRDGDSETSVNGGVVTVVVTGKPLEVFPIGLAVRAEATAPIEQFLDVGERN